MDISLEDLLCECNKPTYDQGGTRTRRFLYLLDMIYDKHFGPYGKSMV